MRKTLSDIIKETFMVLDEKWNVFMCASTLQLLICGVFILFLPPFGFAVAFAFYTTTSVSLARYNIKKYENKKAFFQDIFDFKNFFGILGAKIIRLIQICFWCIFLIVPGIFMAIEYSMTDYILAQNPNMDSFDALNESAKLTRKHRAKIFVLFLLYCLLTAIIMMFACSVIILTKFFTVVPTTIALYSVIIISLLLFLFIVLPFIKVSLVVLYKDLLKEQEKFEINEKLSKK